MNLIILILSSLAFAFGGDDFPNIIKNRQAFDGKIVTVTGTVKELGKSKSLEMVRFDLMHEKFRIKTRYFLSNRKGKLNSSFPCQEGDQVTITGLLNASRKSRFLGSIDVEKTHPVECRKMEVSIVPPSANAKARTETEKLYGDLTRKLYRAYKKDVDKISNESRTNIEKYISQCAAKIRSSNDRTDIICKKIPKEAWKDCSICDEGFYKYGYCLDLLKLRTNCILGKKGPDCEKKESGLLTSHFAKVILRETEKCLKKAEESLKK